MKVPTKVNVSDHKRGVFSTSPPIKGGPFKLTTKTLTCCTADTRNTTLFSRLGLNSFMNSGLVSGGICFLHSWTKMYKVPKCRMNCPMMEMNNAGWKTDLSGVTEDSFGRGLDLDMVTKDTLMSIPRHVISLSPYLIPSKCSTDKEYAEIRQFRARI